MAFVSRVVTKRIAGLCKREYWMEDIALALCEVLLLDRVLRAGTQKLKKMMEKNKEFGAWGGNQNTFV